MRPTLGGGPTLVRSSFLVTTTSSRFSAEALKMDRSSFVLGFGGPSIIRRCTPQRNCLQSSTAQGSCRTYVQQTSAALSFVQFFSSIRFTLQLIS